MIDIPEEDPGCMAVRVAYALQDDGRYQRVHLSKSQFIATGTSCNVELNGFTYVMTETGGIPVLTKLMAQIGGGSGGSSGSQETETPMPAPSGNQNRSETLGDRTAQPDNPATN